LCAIHSGFDSQLRFNQLIFGSSVNTKEKVYPNETRSGRTGFSGEFSVGLAARRDVVSQPAT
jgi:hypothetical protein